MGRKGQQRVMKRWGVDGVPQPGIEIWVCGLPEFYDGPYKTILSTEDVERHSEAIKKVYNDGFKFFLEAEPPPVIPD